MRIQFLNDDVEIIETWSDYYDGVTDMWEIPQVPRRGDEVNLFSLGKRSNIVVTVRKVSWLSPTEVNVYVE